MLSKLITWGSNREEAIIRMKRALGEYQIAGVKTNINSFFWILDHPKFLDSSFSILFLEEEFMPLVPNKWRENVNAQYKNVAAILGAYIKSKERTLKSDKICVSNQNHWENLKYE
jgi:acetyl-CoA carboxylase biotin carboxylase subunit